jgi:hypothetical protein
VTALDVEGVVRAYVAAWNTADVDERRRLLVTCWADEGCYADPTVDLRGRESLVQHVSRFHERWPGAVIEHGRRIDAHHGWCRFAWRVASAEGTTLREGVDFGTLGPDGRLVRIVGFFDPMSRSA